MSVPDTVSHLDDDVVVEVLSRHGVNVSDAADELCVASADLRRLLWSQPALVDMAAELEERRLDAAEKNIYEALKPEDSRRRDAASMFTIRNSIKARRRGWLTSAASPDMVSAPAAGRIVISWIGEGDDEPPDDGKLIEHEAPASDKDAPEAS